jgi:hypothetical protein
MYFWLCIATINYSSRLSFILAAVVTDLTAIVGKN